MAIASVSGLASGLDTSSIISQLMQVEAAPQARLRTRVTAEKAGVTALQKINTQLAALATRAADLMKPGGLSPLATTSSSEHVTVTTRAGAAPASLSVVVGATALTHSLTFLTSAGLTDQVTGASTTVRLTRADGTPVDLSTGDGTLGSLVAALNASGTGVRAMVLKLDDGTYRLSVESSASGAASGFTLTALDGSPLLGGAAVRSGRDAAITIGTDTVHSATNTFTGLLPGIDITVSAATPAGTGADLTVTRDATAATAAMKALVEAVNTAIGDIDTASKVTVGQAGAPLAGDASVRSLRSALLTSVFPMDGSSLSTAGIQVDRYGRLTLDEATFTSAYQADPDRVSAAIAGADGFASRVAAVARAASDSVNGSITQAIKGRTAQIDRLEDGIAAWDVRLELRRSALTRQFAALETALSQVQAQSAWLGSQIASMSGSQEG